jgi:hypothetical protein
MVSEASAVTVSFATMRNVLFPPPGWGNESRMSTVTGADSFWANRNLE